ncbi:MULTISPECIES: HAD family phosphatase [unclassified Pseudomonas]|uniref:HAD family hydrolase n=1 Tax=unclassified Pseudomonas TaxID=196821 RepID=UPI0025799E8B|nr:MULTISPECIES: HAD family hydrolase [unclassified Pseudomonas]
MTLAIFDLDETLIDGDCSSLWCQRMAQLGWVDDSFIQRDAALMKAYAEGALAMEEYMAFALEPLIGRAPEELEPEIDAYVEDVIEPLIFSDACRCIAEHRARGDRIVLISASGAHLVEPIAGRLGISEILAIDLELAHGVYTGRTQGVLTYREGKLTRLLELIDHQEVELADASFYSDSRNDLPLLERVGHPHAVNPDPYLREQASRRGWPILEWK